MGLFNHPKEKKTATKKQIEANLYRTSASYRQVKNSNDYQEKLLNRVNKANEKYRQDGDLNSIIRVYENAFIKANPPCVSSQCFNLVDYYVKAGRLEKALTYLDIIDSWGKYSSDRTQKLRKSIQKRMK